MKQAINKPILFLILLFLLFDTLAAQTDFRQGYIIKNANDTITGLIDFKGDIGNSKSCHFKATEDSNPIQYNPFDIKGYRFINDKYYVSKTININGEQQQKFLEFLLDGIVDLYCYSDVNGSRFFIEKKGETPVEINSPEIENIENGIWYKTKDKKYIGRLKIMFADAPQLDKEIEKVTVDRKSLINISKEYHEQVCKYNKCIIYEKKRNPARINIGPVIGISSIYIIPEDVIFRNVSQGDITFHCEFEPSKSFSYGIFCNISLPTKKDNLKLLYEGLISSHTFSSYNTGDGEHDFSLSSTDLVHYLSMSVAISDKKVKPVLQFGGFANQKLILEKSGFNPYGYLVEIFPKESYFGFSIGLGCAVKISEKKDLLLKATYNQGYGAYIYLNTRELNITLSMPIIQFKLD